jgi:DNA polymerase delta subunit 1
VVYGDTDSVFVVCNNMSTENAWNWMHMACNRINSELFATRAPMKLAPEKMFFTLLFVSKKRYAGYKCEGSLDNRDFYYRGIEVVRRDWCPLVSKTVEQCCHLILRDKNFNESLNTARTVISNLYSGRVELQELLLGASISKSIEKYKNPMRHTRLVEKMRKRDAATAPRVGDRVCYVMVLGSQSSLVREWSEDPLKVLDDDITINVQYYIENQLRKPLTRILSPVVTPEQLSELFNGPHTLIRKVITQKLTTENSRNTLLRFVQRITHPCVICKSQTNQPMFCPECGSNTDRIEKYRAEQQQGLAEIEDLVQQIERVCRSCQQIADNETIVCMARDCPNLYTRHSRTKRRDTLKEKLKQL